jgi:hypothetical protein
LAKVLRQIPLYSKISFVLINEELYFENVSEENITNFKRAMLNLQNIDDRYIFEWNNIRFIGKKEQQVHDFVLMKDSFDKDKNVMSLNFDGDGVSVIGTTHKTGKENQDTSVDHFEINKNNNQENVYQKQLNIMSMDNLQNTLMKQLTPPKPKRTYEDTQSSDAYSFLSIAQSDNGLHINPCFNKGYYNEELKIIGKGNYTECHNLIEKLDDRNATHLILNSKALSLLKTSNHVILFLT